MCRNVVLIATATITLSIYGEDVPKGVVVVVILVPI
jgi:hypothetical protein